MVAHGMTRWSIAARFATQEEAVQAIPASVRPHAAVHRRRRPMEVPAARHNTGAYGKLPVMEEVRREAERRGIKLLILPTLGAIDALRDMDRTNAVLHVTC